MSFNAKSDTPSTTVAATDRHVFGSILLDTWDTIEMKKVAAAHAAVADSQVQFASGVIVGSAAIATNATTGFLYIPSCAGTPTGTPTTFTGRIPLVYDSTNDILYVYRSGWKKAAADILTGAITWV